MKASIIETARCAGRQIAPRGILKRIASDQRGGIAIWFALSIVPVTIAVGSMFDYSRAFGLKIQVQQANDAAILAVAQAAAGDPTMTTGQIKTFVEKYIQGAMGTNETVLVDEPELSPARTTLTVRTSASVRKTFTRLFNRISGEGPDEPIWVSAKSQTIISNATYEIVMVLDNSGSMSGTKIKDLKSAANSLVDTMFENPGTAKRVKIGLVPFTLSVNVGSKYATASWVDSTAKNPLHWQNFTRPTLDGTPATAEIAGLPTSRFDLYARLGEAWDGCVEQRAAPHNLLDTPATASDPNTLFVPMFAPDEPDKFGVNDKFPDNTTYKKDFYPKNGSGTSLYTGRNYPNSYLADFGGLCAYDEANPYRKADKQNARGDQQTALCKYAPTNWLSSRYADSGPNKDCEGKPIVALTDKGTDLKNSINSMAAGGNTNLVEGMMWGWRVLSPELPFDEGKPWDEGNNYKIVIFMTDGENALTTSSSYENKSKYSPFGYLANPGNRLGVTSDSGGAVRKSMDAMTKQACTNVKAKNIQVYTIALGVTDTNNLNLLKGCATKDEMAYSTANSSSLVAIFKEIAANIGKLRLSV